MPSTIQSESLTAPFLYVLCSEKSLMFMYGMRTCILCYSENPELCIGQKYELAESEDQ